MICIIFVAGHKVLLEREILEDSSGKYSDLVNVPKALLPARPGTTAAFRDSDCILDCWWQVLKKLCRDDRHQLSDVYLVTNANKYKHFERWASAHNFPLNNIINDGTTNMDNSLGAIADLDLAIRSKKITDDILVVAGDMLFDHNFDLGQVLDYFQLKGGDVAIYYNLEDGESTEVRGIIEMDQLTGRITRFLEKPQPHETTSRLASPGLAGSSPIITATLRCLMKFFNLTDKDIPKPIRPQFVLDIETKELFIQAGLQDRVIQTYEGLVYMDFSKDIMDSNGYGLYLPMNPQLLSPLWLAYLSDPSDSGRIHSNVKQRWLLGEEKVVQAMKTFGSLTDQAKTAIEEEDFTKLASLMNQNFDLRRDVYTDGALGGANLRMIEIGRKYGSATKFPGSGGAIVGLCLDETKKYQMMQELRSEGFVVCDVVPHCPQCDLPER